MTDREMAELSGRTWVHDPIDMANRQNDIIRRDIHRQRAELQPNNAELTGRQPIPVSLLQSVKSQPEPQALEMPSSTPGIGSTTDDMRHLPDNRTHQENHMFVQLQKEFLGKKPGERIDVDKEHADKLIELGVATAVTDDVITPAVSRAIEGAFGKFTEALNGIVDQSLKQFARVQTHSRKNAMPAIFGPQGEGEKNHNFGDWLLCVRRNDARRLETEYGSFQVDEVGQKTAMTSQSGTTGGYTVPIEFLPRLLAMSAELGVARSRAMVVPMTSRTCLIPYLDITNAPASGDTAFYGGLVGRWTEEASTLNETEPSFRQIELVAHELSGYSLMSNTLLQDNAVGLEAILLKIFGGAIAWYEDFGFLSGNGVGKPQGATNCPAAISVTRSGGANTSTFSLADAAKMVGTLPPGYNPKTTCWVFSPDALQGLIQLASTAGFVVWLNQQEGGAQDMPRLQLLGLPVCLSEKVGKYGQDTDINLIDWSHYLIGDRQMVEIAYSEHFKFTNNQATWRFVSRVDGQPWLRSKITLQNGATVSPYVYLH
jgi:HK97 family phage major capsid protein